MEKLISHRNACKTKAHAQIHNNQMRQNNLQQMIQVEWFACAPNVERLFVMPLRT